MPVPETRRDDTVEVLHGVEVADPYRWLEQPADTPEVRAWIEAQNAWAFEHLSSIPERGEIRARIAELWNHPRRSAPSRKGTAWVQLRNDGLQDQDVLWHSTADPLVEFGTPPLPDDRYWEVLLDPNTLSEDGTTALSGMALTDDGALLAYALSDAGSDWMTWRVRDLGTGRTSATRSAGRSSPGPPGCPTGRGSSTGVTRRPPRARSTPLPTAGTACCCTCSATTTTRSSTNAPTNPSGGSPRPSPTMASGWSSTSGTAPPSRTGSTSPRSTTA
jgi:hypothetical protein